MGLLVGPYLLVLAVTTLIYVRLIAPPAAPQSTAVVDRRTFLQVPAPRAVAREAWSAIREFATKAVPVFVAITFAASLLDRAGAIDALGRALGPRMVARRDPASLMNR